MSGDPDFGDVDDINSRVNSMPYRTDLELYNKPEFWALTRPDVGGDCEDFALVKYRLLYQAGVPKERLRLATCDVRDEGYHAVLLYDAVDGQTWVLDNRFPSLMKFQYLIDREGYRFDKIQVAGTERWQNYA